MSFSKYIINENDKTYFEFWHSRWCFVNQPDVYETYDLCKIAASLNDKVEFLNAITQFTGYSRVHLDTLYEFLKTCDDILYDEDYCPFLNYDKEYETSLWRCVGSCFNEISFYGYFRQLYNIKNKFSGGWIDSEDEYNKIKKYLTSVSK